MLFEHTRLNNHIVVSDNFLISRFSQVAVAAVIYSKSSTLPTKRVREVIQTDRIYTGPCQTVLFDGIPSEKAPNQQ